MPLQTLTPAQLRDRLAAEFDVLFDGADPRRRRSVEGVLVRVLAIVSNELRGYIEWAARQMHVATADGDELTVRAAVWGIVPAPAVAAAGPVILSGTPGAMVPAGDELRRADDARYLLDGDCTIGSGGTATAAVTAVAPGAAGNADAGTALTLIEPVVGVQTGATVASGGLGGGRDREGVESLRARTRARIQQPPHGGAAHDYVAWVREVVGQARVWVEPLTPALGAVTVLFTFPDGAIPDPATVNAVADHIDAERPVTAHSIVVAAPVADMVAFSIALTPDTLLNRTAVEAELEAFLLREAVPGGTIPASRIGAAISGAAGEYSHTVSVPGGDIVSPAGHVARLGVITWL